MRAPCDRGLTNGFVQLTEVGQCASVCWWWWFLHKEFSGPVVAPTHGGSGGWKVYFSRKGLLIVGEFGGPELL